MEAMNNFDARLFEVSNNSGYTTMIEVPAFQQHDMLSNEVYVLDCFSKIYIWIGPKSNKFEYNGAHKKSQEYIKNILDKRVKDQVEYIDVHAGCEPPIFKV